MKQLRVAIAVLMREDEVLICRRKANDTFGGYWEFPGGKCEVGETLEQALVRELKEELALTVLPGAQLSPIVHVYPQVQVTLYPFLCQQFSGSIQPLACDEVRWVKVQELRQYRFPEANVSLIDEVIARFSTGNSVTTHSDTECRSAATDV